MFFEDAPDGAQIFDGIVFEVEVEDDDGPRFSVVLCQGVLDNRPDLIEKVMFERGLSSAELVVVGDNGSRSNPSHILLNSNRKTSRKRAIDPIRKTPFVGITIVR